MVLNSPRILMVDDDQELCRLIISYLRQDGFDATAVHSGAQALQVIRNHQYDVVVLDLMMPEMSGQEVLRRIAGRSGGAPVVPVLMLTAKGDEVDRVVGLETGADDYLAKPCSLRELAARLRAILRRTSPPTSPHSPAVTIGDLTLDAATRQVTLDGRSVNLTGAEFSIMQVLMESAGWPVPKKDLVEKALGRKHIPYDRSIDVHVGNLRKKLAAGGNYDAVIKTIRGRGYLFVADRSKDLA